MAAYKTLDDVDVAGKKVLVRLDLNVPMDDAGKVTDATRIERILPTLKEITSKGGKAIILSHFGRPKGERVPEMSLKPVAAALAEHLSQDVAFADNCKGEPAETAIAAMNDGDVLMLENVRYHKCETENKEGFAKALAKLGDLFVHDAFSCAHRAHASSEGICHHIPSYAGRCMQAELEALSKALSEPVKPVVAVVGGAKVSTKLDLLGNLVAKVDHLIIGGGMANTFLAAQGVDVGKSLCEHDLADTAREITAKAEAAGCSIHLPTDVVVAKEFAANAANETLGLEAVPADGMILDAGKDTVEGLTDVLDNAKTVVWNGPMGAFEIEPFDFATNAVARKVGELTEAGKMLSVAGGGDTVAALNNAGVSEQFSYISTAGGAFLEWLEGKELPGVKALSA